MTGIGSHAEELFAALLGGLIATTVGSGLGIGRRFGTGAAASPAGDEAEWIR